METGLSCVQSH